ncbi:PAAR domain-containing protein [Pseudomonas lundensis]|uniref:PAAR domain-containing protein n=1 Tax=Pseudomonas lundensis TaxID=86185 RepID=UPI001474F66C|nr:PAAR domain-containing protein [Pseudomonas lundensis]NNA00396.1 PAAR domain-containing protein [Pseudomonas lundensis]
MRGIIRIGDFTTGGGIVLTGSTAMKFSGIGVARQGDLVFCPIPGHGLNAIAIGHSAFKDEGRYIAFLGHFCLCGCVLISSLPSAGAS